MHIVCTVYVLCIVVVILVALEHYCDVIMGAMAPQNTSLTIVYSTVHSGVDQIKQQSAASLPFVREFIGDRWIPRTNGGPVTRKMFPFDDAIMRYRWYIYPYFKMTSSNGSIFRVTSPWRGESTGDRWILLIKASDAHLWYFLLCAPEYTVEQTIETPMIWDAIALIMTSL